MNGVTRIFAIFGLAVSAALAFAVTADAAIVTVGPPLNAPYTSESCGTSCTLVNSTLGEAGAHATSPVSGAIVRWRVIEGATAGQYRLRVLTPTGGTAYTATGSSPSVASVPGAGIQTFSSTLPIAAGQTIALDMSSTASIGVGGVLGSAFEQWVPSPGEGPFPAPINGEPNVEIGFDAEVQPAPTITGVQPASGSVKGAQVTISGTDLEGASAVSFGSVPAKAFTVTNENTISATAPASKKLAKVPVTVTTVAGSATSATSFAYVGCKVPSLSGKKLPAAKKRLKKADCKLGKVSRKAGVTNKAGKVVKESPKSGKLLAPGAKVKLTLG